MEGRRKNSQIIFCPVYSYILQIIFSGLRERKNSPRLKQKQKLRHHRREIFVWTQFYFDIRLPYLSLSGMERKTIQTTTTKAFRSIKFILCILLVQYNVENVHGSKTFNLVATGRKPSGW